ncbi:AI-2E family transporter [Arthrobacter agilis]|uniref:AI-2E family transporter n=1 Tax=Arthrobacter agilis TaxID=37921 RepID=UPI000B34C29A|nr:AI-2E family transporter [Arthrobacter agilis]OUM40538.1 AI-2E family transporter [Arthrobacter agilis]PPB45150.1 AI-2E family transporter [Arthrobacter agilis]TPV27849.1 AI-2E family transporter [Arthrobacter agilis]VDR31481.1 pheromone autoinducer 2 transporter [Arthrobacter agilis]
MQRLPGAKPRRALQRAVSRSAAALSSPLPEQPRAPLARPRPQDRGDVPFALRVAASWSWRLGLVIVVGGALVYLLSTVSLLVIPLMIAGLLAALLMPIKDVLRRGMPNGLAVAGTLLGFLGVVAGALMLVGSQLALGFTSLWGQARAGIQQMLDWLAQGPLQLTTSQIDQYLQDLGDAAQNNSASILSGALSFGSTAGHVAAGTLLTVFALIFFLLDGGRIWRFLVGLTPVRARAAVDGAGRRGWTSMASYVRVQMLVAGVDAIGIGLGAFIIGVPLALPLGVLVFLGSFIPIVGALATGSVAVLLALVANGWVNALIMLAIVLLVQQVEGHILQPLIMGPAVALHPLAVVLAVAGGTLLAGIPGALFSVPILAVLNTSVRYIAQRAWEYDPVVARAGWPRGGGSGISGPATAEQAAPPSPASTPDTHAASAAPTLQEEISP